VTRFHTLAAWALVALLAWPWAAASRGADAVGARPPGPGAGPVARWLGPVAALAASWEWVRWTTALRRGELARAHTHAARALALDPVSPEGWLTLAQHLVFDRSAAAVEPDLRRRTAFARAGLDVLRQGEARSRDAAGLALIGGDIAVFLAQRARPALLPPAAGGPGHAEPLEGGHAVPLEGDGAEPEAGDLDWPGGRSALFDEARASYTRARDFGHPDAQERLVRSSALR